MASKEQVTKEIQEVNAKALPQAVNNIFQKFSTKEEKYENGRVFWPLAKWAHEGFDAAKIAALSTQEDIQNHSILGDCYRVVLMKKAKTDKVKAFKEKEKASAKKRKAAELEKEKRNRTKVYKKTFGPEIRRGERLFSEIQAQLAHANVVRVPDIYKNEILSVARTLRETVDTWNKAVTDGTKPAALKDTSIIANATKTQSIVPAIVARA